MVPFIGAAIGVVGNLAKGAVNLFSGKGKAARKEARQAKKEAKDLQKAAEAKAKAAEISQQAAVEEAKATKSNIMAFVAKYWWIALVAVGLFFIIPMLKKKNPVGSRRSSARTKLPGRKMTGATKKSSSGFSKKIHGRTYTSKQAWAKAMQNLRKK